MLQITRPNSISGSGRDYDKHLSGAEFDRRVDVFRSLNGRERAAIEQCFTILNLNDFQAERPIEIILRLE